MLKLEKNHLESENRCLKVHERDVCIKFDQGDLIQSLVYIKIRRIPYIKVPI